MIVTMSASKGTTHLTDLKSMIIFFRSQSVSNNEHE